MPTPEVTIARFTDELTEEGLSAVVAHTGVVQDDDDQTPVRLLDLNTDARAWARVEA